MGESSGRPEPRLVAALASLNRARAAPLAAKSRSEALLRGLELLLEGERRERREGGGAEALHELAALGMSELTEFLGPLLDQLGDALLGYPSRRLAVYGSLRPGESNHHLVAEIPGRWSEGFVRGTLHESGWGATLGYPALVWDEEGPEVPVRILMADGLPEHWDRLDAFEGDAYLRILVPVVTAETECVCNLYALREPPRQSANPTRQSGDPARQSGEASRRSAEASRRSAEASRRSAEASRRSSEPQPDTAERIR